VGERRNQIDGDLGEIQLILEKIERFLAKSDTNRAILEVI